MFENTVTGFEHALYRLHVFHALIESRGACRNFEKNPWVSGIQGVVCLFYWANLPRGKEHEQDRSYARCSTLPYPDQKDQRDRPQHRELRALLFSMSAWVL